MSDRQGVEIDYCPQCRGVWLDRGELDKIIERSEQTFSPQSRSDDRHDRDDRYDRSSEHYGRRKRKGFFGDFFDFD
jgi:Zn-finger nucleic acid-binding protein